MITEKFFFRMRTILDIEVLKKKKVKIENELSTDEKNKDAISHQIRLLTDKLDEIESRQQSKRNALAKIEDTLTQSEIGEISLAKISGSVTNINFNYAISGYSKIIDSLQVLLSFAASKTDLADSHDNHRHSSDHHHNHH